MTASILTLPLELLIASFNSNLSSVVAFSRTCSQARALFAPIVLYDPTLRERVQRLAFARGYIFRFTALLQQVPHRSFSIHLSSFDTPSISALIHLVSNVTFVKGLHLRANQEVYANKQRVPLANEHFLPLIRSSSQLLDLELDTCRKLTKPSLSAISELTKLRSLSLHLMKIGSIDLKKITANCLEIETLRLSRCVKLSSLALATISRLTNLRHLDLTRSHITDRALEQIWQKAKNLAQLSLVGCTYLSSPMFSEPNKTITFLDISKSSLKSSGVMAMLKSTKALKTFYANDLDRVSKLTFYQGDRIISLTTIQLNRTYISCSSLWNIVTLAPNLCSLSLRVLTHLQAETFLALKRLSKLEFLDISWTQFDDRSLEQVVSSCTALKKLGIYKSKVTTPPAQPLERQIAIIDRFVAENELLLA